MNDISTEKISSVLRWAVRSMINCYPLKSASSSTKQNSASAAIHVYILSERQLPDVFQGFVLITVCVKEISFLSIIQALCDVQNKFKWVIYTKSICF